LHDNSHQEADLGKLQLPFNPFILF